jgi:hypothetical protein
MLRHLYVAFWRPDILAKFVADHAKTTGICDYVGPATQFSTTLADVTCGACRESFLAALPTGNGVKTTWTEYLAQEAARPKIKTLKERAAEFEAAKGWSTAAPPKADPYLAGIQQRWPSDAPKADPGGWSTTPDPGGWKTS